MTQVIGYAYEAALHCVDCTRTRIDNGLFSRSIPHNNEPDEHGIFTDWIDNEGNPISAVLSTHERGDSGDYCDDCRANLRDDDIKPLNVPVRFFIYDDEENEGEGDIRECDEGEFIDCEYPIEYERNTVFANGCNQICLTKMPKG